MIRLTSASLPPFCRYSSAKPRIDVSGVRSSWLASATNRRIRASEERADSSESRRSSNAVSIWPSITFNAWARPPTSVRGSASGTRRVRSPAAMASAVCSTSTSGRRLDRIST